MIEVSERGASAEDVSHLGSQGDLYALDRFENVQAKFSVEGDEIGSMFKARTRAVSIEDADIGPAVFFDDGF